MVQIKTHPQVRSPISHSPSKIHRNKNRHHEITQTIPNIFLFTSTRYHPKDKKCLCQNISHQFSIIWFLSNQIQGTIYSHILSFTNLFIESRFCFQSHPFYY